MVKGKVMKEKLFVSLAIVALAACLAGCSTSSSEPLGLTGS